MFNWWQIGDNAGQGRTRMWFWFRKSWQARATGHLALPCWKTWSKLRCCRKGRTIGSSISSLNYTAFNVCPWTILSCVRPSWQIQAQTTTLAPPKRSDSHTHWSVKRSPRLRYTRQRPSIKRSENRDSSLKRMCCHVWSLHRRRARAQASLAILWRCLRIGPTIGRLTRFT